MAKVISKNKVSSSSPSSGRSSKSLKKMAIIEEWELNAKNAHLNDIKNYDGLIVNNLETDSPTKSVKNLRRTSSAKSRHSIQEEIDRANFAVIQEEQLPPEAEESAKNQEQLMTCILTIAALSLHSLIEGLSIGIQQFQYEIWYIFIAVSVHSASILFCIGVELILAQTRLKFVVMQMTALALASPIGILLGLLVAENTSAKPSTMSVVSIVLEGFSAGAILYITFFEVLNREKERRVYRVRRGLCIVGGFLLMAALQFSESQYEKHGSLATSVNATE